jgi:hypothetical protein
MIAVAAIILIILGLFIANLAKREPTENASSDGKAFAKGVSLSPRSFDSADFTDFFVKVRQAGEVVSWAGDWSQLNITQEGAAKVLASLAPTYGYVPLIEAQFFTQTNGALLRPLDDTTVQAYRDAAVAFVEKYNLQYLALGIEVNMLYEKSPTDFSKFVQIYNDVYDAVKAKSPETKVFTIFQLEKMKGLNGGLFGGINDPEKSQWNLLDAFPKSDIIAFTTYPGIIYTNPNQIPEEYYSEIRLHTSIPVAFTEIGWHSQANPAGWESSEAEQAEFVNNFFNLTKNLNLEMAVWSFLYDQNTTVPFNSMGLWSDNGTAKIAWSNWINNK